MLLGSESFKSLNANHTTGRRPKTTKNKKLQLEHTESYDLVNEKAINYDELRVESSLPSSRAIENKHLQLWLYRSKSQNNSPRDIDEFNEPPRDELDLVVGKFNFSHQLSCKAGGIKDTMFMPKMHLQKTDMSQNDTLQNETMSSALSPKTKTLSPTRRSCSGGRHTQQRSVCSKVNISINS